jgi:hypothetical protein
MIGDEGERFTMPPLTADDLCDKRECDVRALVKVVTLSGDVMFCGHHYALIEHAVRPVAAYVQDERGAGPRLDVRVALEPDGKMHHSNGIRWADQCRGCMGRFERRSTNKGVPRTLFVCPTCDESAANFDDWRVDFLKK